MAKWGYVGTLLLAMALMYTFSLTLAHRTETFHIGEISYVGQLHVAHGLLAKDLVLKPRDFWETKIKCPQKGLGRTFACWIFPEDTYSVGGNGEIELYVDGKRVTHFAIAQGKPGEIVQSLAEHITDFVSDVSKEHMVRLKNVGDTTIIVEELFIRWIIA